jgi:hypothetical protein
MYASPTHRNELRSAIFVLLIAHPVFKTMFSDSPPVWVGRRSGRGTLNARTCADAHFSRTRWDLTAGTPTGPTEQKRSSSATRLGKSGPLGGWGTCMRTSSLSRFTLSTGKSVMTPRAHPRCKPPQRLLAHPPPMPRPVGPPRYIVRGPLSCSHTPSPAAVVVTALVPCLVASSYAQPRLSCLLAVPCTRSPTRSPPAPPAPPNPNPSPPGGASRNPHPGPQSALRATVPVNRLGVNRTQGLGWEITSRGRFATPAQSFYHDWKPVPRATRTPVHVRRESVGVVPRSRAALCRPVTVRIRNKQSSEEVRGECGWTRYRRCD